MLDELTDESTWTSQYSYSILAYGRFMEPIGKGSVSKGPYPYG